MFQSLLSRFCHYINMAAYIFTSTKPPINKLLSSCCKKKLVTKTFNTGANIKIDYFSIVPANTSVKAAYIY